MAFYLSFQSVAALVFLLFATVRRRVSWLYAVFCFLCVVCLLHPIIRFYVPLRVCMFAAAMCGCSVDMNAFDIEVSSWFSVNLLSPFANLPSHSLAVATGDPSTMLHVFASGEQQTIRTHNSFTLFCGYLWLHCKQKCRYQCMPKCVHTCMHTVVPHNGFLPLSVNSLRTYHTKDMCLFVSLFIL